MINGYEKLCTVLLFEGMNESWKTNYYKKLKCDSEELKLMCSLNLNVEIYWQEKKS